MIVELLRRERNQRYQDSPLMYAPPCSGNQGIDITRIGCYKTKLEKDDFEVIEGLNVKEEHPRCYQAEGSRVEENLDGAFVGVRDEEVVVGEGVVVTSSSLEMLTNICLGGIMVSLILLKGLEEEALVEFVVEWFEEDEDGKKNGKDDLFN
nr:hypothetical protein [Tanacetum cinerariifolium]